MASKTALLFSGLGDDVKEQAFEFGGRQRAEAMNHGAGTDGWQKLLRIFSQQDQRGVVGRLFEKLEQAVGGLFHECRRSKNREGTS